MVNIVIDNPVTGKRQSLTKPEFNSYMAQTNGAVLKWIVASDTVIKHEEHDQKTHGSWARGESFKMISSLIDKLSQINTPGFSINIISKKKPRSGYMVSDFEKEKPIPSKDFFSSRSASKGYIKDYIKDNAQELSEKGAYLGGWVYKGKVYLDVSRRYASKTDAVYALFDNKQISGYNVEQDSYFYRKDEVDDRANKASNGGSTQASQSDDRRGTGLLRGGSSPSNRGQSLTYPHICLGRYSVLPVEKHLEGQHDQATHGNWAGDRYPADSLKSARDGAKEYAFKKGLKPDESIDYTKVVANRERASKIADLYESLPKMDRDAVDEYEALASEVEEQFNYMTKTLGVKVEFVADDPYKTSKEMFADVSTGSLKVLSTATTGAHPIFSDEQNNKFRAVHDYFGHAATGRGFGQDGEESAWVHHSQMFTKNARAALTTETRGQNSFFNNRGKQFADQKVALLPEEFWAVPKVFQKTKVIYFALGLKPVLKHLPGEHDQQKHGRWAHFTGAEGIAEMSERGLTEQELLNLVENGVSGTTETQTLEGIIEEIENTEGLYEQAIEGIDEELQRELGALQTIHPNHKYTEQEKMEVYERIQSDMIQNLAEGMLYEQENRDQSGEEENPDTTELVAKFNETFGYSQEVQSKLSLSSGKLSPNGTKGTLASKINGVAGEEGRLEVRGAIEFKTRLGSEDRVGAILRTFYLNDQGDLSVEHDYFRITDERLQGTGFGRKFLEQSENYYISHGVKEITVGTAWDGARHWAREGFDFNPEYAKGNYIKLKSALDIARPKISEGAQKKWEELLERMADPNTLQPKPMTNDDYPLPYEFAMVGYRKGAKNWAGKTILMEGGTGTRLKYKKVLTEEGTSLLGGPVDRDGDGLIYDGTARERSAPTKSEG